jgi:hypothetical protein
MKLFIVLGFVMSGLVHAQGRPGLTEVVRESCVSFPKVIDAQAMKEGIHYLKDSYCLVGDEDGYCEERIHYYMVRYNFHLSNTIEYWTADGRLVTSKQVSTKSERSFSVTLLSEAESKIKTEIEGMIYRYREPVCADSYYR